MAAPTRLPPLAKSKSWSPDIIREESWQRRCDLYEQRRRYGTHGRSVTDEDLEELRGCVDLGFTFDASPECRRLSSTIPALDLLYALQSPSSPSSASSSPSPASSPLPLYSPGENPQKVKEKLKQWAQIVACTVRQQY